MLTRLREAGLKLKPSKCQLLRKSVHYLVSERGVETDPAKIECVPDHLCKPFDKLPIVRS